MDDLTAKSLEKYRWLKQKYCLVNRCSCLKKEELRSLGLRETARTLPGTWKLHIC